MYDEDAFSHNGDNVEFRGFTLNNELPVLGLSVLVVSNNFHIAHSLEAILTDGLHVEI